MHELQPVGSEAHGAGVSGVQAAGVVPAGQGVQGDEQARLVLAQRPPVVRAEADG